MGIVCPSCDLEPPNDATAGGPCVACGARLVLVDARDDLVGSIVDGRFEVLGRLGKGGMGVVYRARQRSIDREVALKVLDRHVEQDVASVKRFFREAKLASTLAHPNTVAIIDFGQSQDARLYIAMELVRGHNLFEEITEHGAVSVERAASMGVQLCDALEVAHGMSIVHRDLKLENVMLVDGGRDHVKILDFGLARSLTDPNTRATATGLISGTPRYMAPEVVLEGAEPAPAQDMYAVGVILAELCLGRALWTAPTLASLFTIKLEVDAAIAEVPSSLRGILRGLLDLSPEARPTAAQLRASLRRVDPSKDGAELAFELEPEVAVKPPQGKPGLGALATAPTADIAFPDLDELSLVGVDGSSIAPPPETATPTSPTQHVATPATRLRFDPHTGASPALADTESLSAIPGPPLELDRSEVAYKQAKQAAAARAFEPKRTSIAGIVVVLALVAAGAGVALYVVKHKPPPVRTGSPPQPGSSAAPVGSPAEAATVDRASGSSSPVSTDPGSPLVVPARGPRPASTVSIEILAARGAAVSIDGHSAGHAPATVYVHRGGKPIAVTVTIDGVELTQSVVPDRDQTLNLSTR